MNPILIVREEIICLAILLFILFYSSLYKMGKDLGFFLRICIFAIGHVVFDLITVLTVNNLETVPSEINWICHIIFYIFALLFAYEFFCYTVSLCYSKRTLHIIRYMGLAPIILYLITVKFLEMVFIFGNGSNYSFGTAAIVGYGVAMMFFVASIIVVLKHCKKLNGYVVGALLPMQFAAIAAEIIQIMIPELLFTGGAITIITVGFFFSLENPVAVLRQKVQIDTMTGLKSRHSYEQDVLKMDKKFEAGVQFGMVFCDINDLKAVNDSRGHLEGDAYIASVAQILMKNFKNSERIYRMGGDEFLAVYQNKSIGLIRKETAAAKSACEEQSKLQGYQISVSMGYAISDSSYRNLRDVLRTADYQMYANKANYKLQKAYLLNDSENLNIVGLTDRIFDAFASTDCNRFLFVSNMATNVTRWSHSAVEYFGLKSEFIFDCNTFWGGLIHPEDRDAFYDDISAVFYGKQKTHDLQYRIRNGSGDYVTCACNGTILSGKNGEPDLFAGTMEVLDVNDSIDPITELRNVNEMINYFNYLIRNKIPAAILKISILNISRINMLYGHKCGNDILKQFALVIHAIAGSESNIFRADGTRFVVCIPESKREILTDIYNKIQLVAEQRIYLDALTPPLQIAAGAFMLPKDFNGSSSVLRSNLIFAHDKSKYENRGRLCFYDDSSVIAYSEQQNKLLLSIHQDAITKKEGFFLVYQPIVSVKSSKIVGAEALLRWESKDFGIVNPDQFVPWLEGDPCFFNLGNWILRKALTEAKAILAYQKEFIINVNIAMPQLEREGFRRAVLEILNETAFPPNQLCLELTERCREMNPDFLKTEIEFFRNHQIQVALDDLGTGFSSFGLLLSLNVDEIKIDRTFVKEIRSQRVNQILTKMLIDASNSMGYSICLEGVEDKELCHYLKDYGATYYQGYYCAKPMRIRDFIIHMERWNEEN